MIRTGWILAGALLWVAGAVGGTRRSVRSGAWLLLGSLGTGLACIFWGMLEGAASEPARAFWTRLLWGTLTLALPAWVAFSYRFGRPAGAPRASSEKGAVFAFWLLAVLLTFAGLTRAPVHHGILGQDRSGMILSPPWGRVIVFLHLCGAIVIFWNLHATLEAARASGRKRVAECIYSLVPALVTGIYVIADILIYGAQTAAKTRLLIPALLITTLAFVSAMGRRRLGEATLPVGRPVVYSSVVLSALGLFLVGLALLSQLLGLIGVTWESRWYERAAVTALLGGVLLWILPGLRASIRRFVDRNLYASRFDYRSLWEKVNHTLGTVSGPGELPEALRGLLRDLFGTLHVQLWLADAGTGEFIAPGEPGTEPIPRDHPIARALGQASDALVLSGEAGSVNEIPLYAAGEAFYQRYGLRVFYPIRSRSSLVGILGCGPGGRSTLHPEDLDVLRTVAEHLGGVLAVSRTPSEGRGAA